MDDNSIMPFGDFKGEKLANVPAKYLIWLYNTNQSFGKLKEYIQENMEVLELEIERESYGETEE